jgi:hypothetical protein
MSGKVVKTVHGLPLQSALHERRIDQVLGVGGFAIKEDLPGELATRANGTVVPVSTEREEDYRWGLERFLLRSQND